MQYLTYIPHITVLRLPIVFCPRSLVLDCLRTVNDEAEFRDFTPTDR